MKLSFKNRLLWAFVFTGIVATAFFFKRQNSGITYGTSMRMSQMVNVHAGPSRWISIKGNKYEGVQGREPYYLPISGSDLVFFVTADDRLRQFEYRFISMTDGRIWNFGANDGLLGRGVGTPDDAFVHDWLDSVALPKVRIATRLFGEVRKFEFDLD